MGLLPADFKSAASADFAIRANRAVAATPILSNIVLDHGRRDETDHRSQISNFAMTTGRTYCPYESRPGLSLRPWRDWLQVHRTTGDTFPGCA
jgi:hypothetical protein